MKHKSLCSGALLFYNPAPRGWVPPVLQPGESSVSSILLLVFPLFIHMCPPELLRSPFWRCRSWETAAFFQPVAALVAATAWSLPLWTSAYTVSDWWVWAYEGRAARLYGDPGLCVSPGLSFDGRLCECLWLQGWVVCQRGGSVSVHLPLRRLAVMAAH